MTITHPEDLFRHENLMQIIATCISLMPSEKWQYKDVTANSITMHCDSLRVTITTNLD